MHCESWYDRILQIRQLKLYSMFVVVCIVFNYTRWKLHREVRYENVKQFVTVCFWNSYNLYRKQNINVKEKGTLVIYYLVQQKVFKKSWFHKFILSFRISFWLMWKSWISKTFLCHKWFRGIETIIFNFRFIILFFLSSLWSLCHSHSKERYI